MKFAHPFLLAADDGGSGSGGGGQPTPGPSEPGSPPAPTAPPTPTPPSQPTDTGNGGRYDATARIRELNAEKATAEQEAADAKARLKEIEDRDLSEKERAEKERDEAIQGREAAEAKATRLERAAWAEAAARSKNFIDPSDAAVHLDLSALDTEAKVANAVEKLAEQKKHLVATRPAGGFGNPGGTAVTTSDDATDPETGEKDEKLAQGRELLQHLSGAGS